MMYCKFVSLISILLLFQDCVFGYENILCSEQFCERYKEDKDCLISNAACQVQNSSYNGELFPGIVPCNCCDFCIEHLNENDFCTIGSPDFSPPIPMCGPGQYCVQAKNKKDYICKKMENTPCFKEQIQYDKLDDEKKVGAYVQRPSCDGDGNYNPIKCNIGQTCFCVDENGNRIFGESAYTLNVEMTMKCECSRLHWKFPQSWFRYDVPISRCLEDGSFDAMQCTGEDCFCIESFTGSPTLKKYNVPQNNYASLPCYNNVIHRSYTYLHDCEKIQFDLLDEAKISEEEQFTPLDVKIPKCQPDGWFPSIRESKTTKFCIDRYGRTLDPYKVLKNSLEAKNMNCNCARTENILRRNKISIRPKCCPNGNFEKIQCRNKTCYCVDENGLQISKEVPKESITKLPCYQNGKLC